MKELRYLGAVPLKAPFRRVGTQIAWLAPGHPWNRRLALFIATAGGAGHAPIAPGTAGSLVGLALFLPIANLSWVLQLLLLLLTFGVALWSVTGMQRHFGLHDDPRIVIDEVLGMWVTLFALPVSWGSFLVGFLLFRLLDIYKVFPANRIDRYWNHPAGVLADDIVSGIYGLALLRFGLRLWGLT